jgi:VWFA-related protein
LAAQLSGLTLTERLSAARIARCEAAAPGPRARQALMALADISAFLDPPASELPTLPTPSLDAQRKIIAMTVDYVTNTVHQLPNFFATRVTTSFQDNPSYEDAPGDNSVTQPLHFVGRYSASVLYRKGKEELRAASSQSGPQGLTTSGEFGPVLGTALVDSVAGNLAWSRWEQEDGKPRAVFRFSVSKDKSHYDLAYCCVKRSGDGSLVSFHQFSGYHGEITVDPSSGTVLRLALRAVGLKRPDPIFKADLIVEYGPVKLGNRTYICPLRGIALSVVLAIQPLSGPARDNDPLQTLLNDVAFEQYHVYHSEARLLAGNDETPPDSAPENSASPTGTNTGPATPAPEVATAIPSENPATPDSTKNGTTTPSPEKTATPAPSSPSPQPRPGLPDSEITVSAATALPDTPPSPDAPFSIRTNARLVDVPVVAYDKKGRPLTDLNSTDFEIYDDGRKQTIRFFSATTDAPAESPASTTAPSPQPAYTNRRPTTTAAAGNAPESSATILLIDAGNLAWPDLSNARRQILAFLQALPPGERAALYVLQANSFQVLAETTADHATLAAKLSHWMPTAQDLARARQMEERNRQQFDDVRSMDDLQSVNGNTNSSPDTAATVDPKLLANGSDPTRDTLPLLANVARHLATIPGHKTLVWVSSDNVLADFADKAVRRDKGGNSVDGAVLRTQEALNDAHVSLYPLDASQLETAAVDSSLANMSVQVAPGTMGSPTPQGGADKTGRLTEEMQVNSHPIRTAIQQMAAATGGRAFPRSGDMVKSLDQAVGDGRATYLLSFAPDSPADDQYHQLTVKLANRRGVTLRYRTGYLYTKEPATLKDRLRQAIARPLDTNEITLSATPLATPRGAALKLSMTCPVFLNQS